MRLLLPNQVIGVRSRSSSMSLDAYAVEPQRNKLALEQGPVRREDMRGFKGIGVDCCALIMRSIIFDVYRLYTWKNLEGYGRTWKEF